MSKSIKFKVDISALQKKFDTVEQAIIDGAKSGIESAMSGAEAEVKERILRSGTYGSAKRFDGAYGKFAGPGLSGTGRIDTGRMYEAVRSFISRNKTTITGTVGWAKDSPDYFKFQEEGFDYVTNSYPISGAPHRVEGMFALRDAQTLLNRTAPGLVSIAISRNIKRFGK